MIASGWYHERLRTKQERDVALWRRHLASLEAYRANAAAKHLAHLDLTGRIAKARAELDRVSKPQYLQALVGTIGADPFHLQMPGSDRPERTADPKQDLSPLVHFTH
jgi:hypothetical protein